MLAANPRAGIGVVGALHGLGRTDVALVSFGDFPLADTLTPGVTVVNQDPRRIGTIATERLLARLDGNETGPGREVIVPAELVQRGSGELRPPEVTG